MLIFMIVKLFCHCYQLGYLYQYTFNMVRSFCATDPFHITVNLGFSA